MGSEKVQLWITGAGSRDLEPDVRQKGSSIADPNSRSILQIMPRGPVRDVRITAPSALSRLDRQPLRTDLLNMLPTQIRHDLQSCLNLQIPGTDRL